MSAEALRARIGWLAGHWKVYRREAPLLIAMSLTNASLAVAGPYLLKQIFDGIQGSLGAAYLAGTVAVLVALGVGQLAVSAGLQWLRARLNLRFQFAVRLRAFEHLTRLGSAFFGRFRTGDLVTRLNDDVNDKLSWYMCSGIFRVLDALLVIAACTAAMLWISPRLTLYTAGPLPLLIGLFIVTATRLHQRYAVVQRSISALNDALESCFSGIRVVKAFAAEPRQQRLVEAAIEENRRAEVSAVRWQSIIDTLYGNVWQLAVVGLLLAGGAMVMEGRLSIGDLIALEAYTALLVGPMLDVGQFLVRGRLSAVSIDRLAEVERTPPEVLVPGDPPPQPRRPHDPPPEDYSPPVGSRAGLDVELRTVTYRYPGAESDALCGVSLRARAGRLTALVGETGAGKSTLLALLPRLVDPSDGGVLAGGVDLRAWDLLRLRQAIGYVPQEALLISGSVLENIRFGRRWVSDDDLQMALRVCQLRDDLARWPAGLETVVGSRGLRLSGGQKQRVALARAVAGRPQLLLLDDCTASLDAETEAAVWQRLLSEIPDCTTLLVTHRPATLRRAAEIIVLERGGVVQRGTFDEVDAPGSCFHRLYVQWQRQDV